MFYWAFHSRASSHAKFLEQTKAIAQEKILILTGLVWFTNMTTILVFRDTNMATVTFLCEHYQTHSQCRLCTSRTVGNELEFDVYCRYLGILA